MEWPLPRNNGTESYGEICFAIGHLIVKWEHLETRIFYLFQNLQEGDYLSAQRVYSSHASFQGRMKLVLGLAEVRLRSAPQLLADLGRMLERVKNLSRKRNEVVHGQLADLTSAEMGKDGTEKVVEGGFICGSVYGRPFNYDVPFSSYFYDAKQIMNFAEQLSVCRNDVNDLADAIKASLQRPEP